MPRGRTKGSTNKPVKTTGPAEEAVVVEDEQAIKIAALEAKIAELEKPKVVDIRTPVVEKQKVTYHKIRFRNLYDPGVEVGFNLNGEHFDLEDGQECELRKDVVDHLNAIQIRKSKITETEPGKFKKEYTYRSRVLCEILDTYEKEV